MLGAASMGSIVLPHECHVHNDCAQIGISWLSRGVFAKTNTAIFTEQVHGQCLAVSAIVSVPVLLFRKVLRSFLPRSQQLMKNTPSVF